MPRLRLKPEARQRVAWACNPCKASKKRCDGHQPCRTCDKKGWTDTCCYTVGRRNNPPPLPRSPSRHQQRQPYPVANARQTGLPAGPLPVLSNNQADTQPFGDVLQHAPSVLQQDGSDSISSSGSDIRLAANESFGSPEVMLLSSSGEKGT